MYRYKQLAIKVDRFVIIQYTPIFDDKVNDAHVGGVIKMLKSPITSDMLLRSGLLDQCLSDPANLSSYRLNHWLRQVLNRFNPRQDGVRTTSHLIQN